MDILDAAQGAYLVVAGLALCMTRLEQREAIPLLFLSLGYLACILWPLPVMAMLVQQRLPRPKG